MLFFEYTDNEGRVIRGSGDITIEVNNRYLVVRSSDNRVLIPDKAMAGISTAKGYFNDETPLEVRADLIKFGSELKVVVCNKLGREDILFHVANWQLFAPQRDQIIVAELDAYGDFTGNTRILPSDADERLDIFETFIASQDWDIYEKLVKETV